MCTNEYIDFYIYCNGATPYKISHKKPTIMDSGVCLY